MSFSFDFIDFSNINTKNTTKDDEITIPKKSTSNLSSTTLNDEKSNLKLSEYDSMTLETYRIKRLFKIDPISNEKIPPGFIFEFPYKWNPYTGERCEIDIVGPLCFHALTLYEYFYKNRLNGLWNPAQDQFEGYYGDLLGTGQNIEIKSRGQNPQKYLFRLPIIDCYLTNNHNNSIVTMGPILTDKEIEEIDKIIVVTNNYRLTLKIMKIYYDNSIADHIPETKIDEFKQSFPHLNDQERLEKYNRMYVELLKKAI